MSARNIDFSLGLRTCNSTSLTVQANIITGQPNVISITNLRCDPNGLLSVFRELSHCPRSSTSVFRTFLQIYHEMASNRSREELLPDKSHKRSLQPHYDISKDDCTECRRKQNGCSLLRRCPLHGPEGLFYLAPRPIYGIFFHPLAHVPGPWLARDTSAWLNWHGANVLHSVDIIRYVVPSFG